MAPQEINAYYSLEFNKIGKISANVPVAVTPCMHVHKEHYSPNNIIVYGQR